jgi:hypothetical protein
VTDIMTQVVVAGARHLFMRQPPSSLLNPHVVTQQEQEQQQGQEEEDEEQEEEAEELHAAVEVILQPIFGSFG